MTLEESYKITKMKRNKYDEQDGKCHICGIAFKIGDKVELAHKIPQRVWIIAKYGKEIIHHEMNMDLTHSGICNSRNQINPESLEAKELIEKIRSEINGNPSD